MATKAKKAIPDGYHTITPHLVLQDTARALEFYKKAFGAELMGKMDGPGGKVVHAEIRIGDSRIMMADEMPGMSKAPQSLGGTASSLMIYTENCDALFERAVKAGATSRLPPTDMFWGDRYGKVTDPFGHEWSIGTHKEDVPEAEMAERSKKAMSQMAEGKPPTG